MRLTLLAAATITAATLVGCKNEDTVTPTTAPSTAPTMAEKLKDDAAAALEKTKEGAAAAGEKIKDGAAAAGEKIKEGAATVSEKASDLKDKAATKTEEGAAAVKEGTTGEPSMMAKLQEQATKYYEQAMDAVKKKDFSAADSAVANLEKIKGQLSPEWQSKIDTLKATVEQAKRAGAVKIPGVTE